MKTKDFALQLAASKAKQADQEILLAQARTTQEEQEAIIRTLRQQMEALQQTNKSAECQSQQGAPHLSGSGVSPPRIRGVVRLCRVHSPQRSPILFGHWRMV